MRMRLWFATGVLFLASTARATVPSAFSVQGVLRDNMGKLQSMTVNVTVALFDASTGGNKLAGPYGPTAVMATSGLFTLPITDANLQRDLAGVSQVWLEVTVGSDTLSRQPVTPQLFALMCGAADVANAIAGPVLKVTDYSVGVNPASLLLQKAHGTQATPATVAAGDILGQVSAAGYDGIRFAQSGSIRFRATQSFSTTAIGTAIDFFTSPNNSTSEHPPSMLIDQNGNVGIGTTTPKDQLEVVNPAQEGWAAARIAAPNGTVAQTTYVTKWRSWGIGPGVGDTTDHFYIVDLTRSNVPLVTVDPITGDTFIRGNLAIGGSCVGCSSDVRLKTNIRTLDDALGAVQQLRGVRFNWKKDGKPGIGVIAQETEKVYPELVSTGADGMKMVDYAKLAGTFIEAIKTLTSRSSTQTARLDQIAAENKALAEKNRALSAKLEHITSENAALVARLKRLESAVDRLASVSPKRRQQMAAVSAAAEGQAAR